MILISCEEDSPTGLSNGDVTISDNTIVIEEEGNVSIDSVSDGEIVLSFTGSAPDISVGDILVSGEGNGFLRKVTSTSVEGNTITVTTQNARITDAVENGSVDTTIPITISTSALGKGVNYNAIEGVTLVAGGIDLTNVILYSGSVSGEILTVSITEGSIDFSPSLNIGFKVESGKIQEFHAVADGDLTLDVDFRATSTGDVVHSDEIYLISIPIGQFVQFIGIFPVVEVVTLDIYAGFKTNIQASGDLVVGLDNTSSVSVGAKYDQGQWTSVWENTSSLTSHPITWPLSSSIELEGYVEPRISVKFYAVAGPYISVVPNLLFDGEIGGAYAWFYELKGGISANLGFDVSVLGYQLANYSTELLNWETLLESDQSTWSLLIQDTDETWERDIDKLYVTSNSTSVVFQLITNGEWIDPHSEESGIDVGIFIDVDQNTNTGLNEGSDYHYQPNDIGADYVAVVGVEGDSLWNWQDTSWNKLTDFQFLNLDNNSNTFEVGVRLSDIGNPSAIDIVIANITFGADTTYWDWAPNAGHVTYNISSGTISLAKSGFSIKNRNTVSVSKTKGMRLIPKNRR